ncbi:MAG: DUF1801 domain-containing protein [Bacteroidota bacterium]
MKQGTPLKVTSIVQLYDLLHESERVMVDILRQVARENLPAYCKEKISYNVPFFYGRRSICIIWPAAIPRGGIKEGVLLGFWYGNRLNDEDNYLTHGTNKQVFYKVYKSPEEINIPAIIKLLAEAVRFDREKANSRTFK